MERDLFGGYPGDVCVCESLRTCIVLQGRFRWVGLNHGVLCDKGILNLFECEQEPAYISDLGTINSPMAYARNQ